MEDDFNKKTPAPSELDELKRKAEEQGLSDKEAYDALSNPLKAQVRESLMSEQGHLCAYCMRRIPDERILEEDTDQSDVYIEHWQAISAARKTGENKGLDYNNMLAVCSGNEKALEATGKRKKRYFTCDKKRGNASLKINPLDVSTLETIYYLSDGTIKSTDEEIEKDIDIKLNLNCSTEAVTLPQNRKAVLDAIQADLINQDGGDWCQKYKDQLDIWENENDPKVPYIGIAIWWLKDQIRHLSGEK
ncbi:MAG: TIGR02646 family protein [Clostridiaceae bacterium]|nr:TIGR02646 family protein [Clostridiaceae bacterium]